MKPKFENWTIVSAGLWDPRVLNQEWVGANLFADPHMQMQVVIDPEGVKYRYEKDNIVFIPSLSKIVIGVKSNEDDDLRTAVEMMKKTVEAFPHTPVSALGFNFGFVEDGPPENLVALFDLNDRSALSDQGVEIKGLRINRTLHIDESIINLSAAFEGGVVNLHSNHHFNTQSTDDTVAALDSNDIIVLRNRTLDLLDNIYGIQLSEAEDEE